MSAVRLHRPGTGVDFSVRDALAVNSTLDPASVLARISPLHAMVQLPAAASGCGGGGGCMATCVSSQGFGSEPRCTFLCATQPPTSGPVVVADLVAPYLRPSQTTFTPADFNSCVRQCTDTMSPAQQTQCRQGCVQMTGAPQALTNASSGCLVACTAGCPPSTSPSSAQCVADCRSTCGGRSEEGPVTTVQPTLYR
jgi:hypothetical protein